MRGFRGRRLPRTPRGCSFHSRPRRAPGCPLAAWFRWTAHSMAHRFRSRWNPTARVVTGSRSIGSSQKPRAHVRARSSQSHSRLWARTANPNPRCRQICGRLSLQRPHARERFGPISRRLPAATLSRGSLPQSKPRLEHDAWLRPVTCSPAASAGRAALIDQAGMARALKVRLLRTTGHESHGRGSPLIASLRSRVSAS